MKLHAPCAVNMHFPFIIFPADAEFNNPVWLNQALDDIPLGIVITAFIFFGNVVTDFFHRLMKFLGMRMIVF